MTVCETGAVPAIEPSEEFLAAARAFVRAQETLERRRKELGPLMASEVERGVKLSRVAKETGYTRETVRRVAREHGVEGDPTRTPPPRRDS